MPIERCSMPKPRTFDHGSAVNMYLDGLTYKQIGLLLGAKITAVRYALTAAGVTESDKGRRPYESWAEKLVAAETAANLQGVPK